MDVEELILSFRSASIPGLISPHLHYGGPVVFPYPLPHPPSALSAPGMPCPSFHPPAAFSAPTATKIRSPAIAATITAPSSSAVSSASSSEVTKRSSSELQEPSSADVRPASAHRSRSEIVYYLPKSERAGLVLSHSRNSCSSVLEKFRDRREPVAFKFGITSGPEHRWENPSYGYRKDHWQKMYVLHKSQEAGSISMLEAAMIALFDGEPGLQNESAGGENPPQATPCYFYLVVRGFPGPAVSRLT